MTALNYDSPLQKSQGKTLLLTLLIVIASLWHNPSALAKDKCDKIDDLDDRLECYKEKYESTSKELGEIREKKDQITQKISTLSSSLNITQQEIDELSYEINQLQASLDKIKAKLEEKRADLEDKIALRNKVIRNYAKRNTQTELELFFGSFQESTSLTGFQYSALNYMFNKSINSEALRLIGVLNAEITAYENDKNETESLKNELETEKNNLVAVKAQLAEQQKNAQKDLQETESEIKDLEEKIEELSEKQQEILKKKYGDDIISGYEAAEYKLPDPPFKPAFAAMSYGAYTHYNGMSQYGAKGRAEDGQDYKEILKHYYQTDVTKKDDFPKKINVQGHGELDFQYYLYGIAEMPSDWPIDALKAQAIAARSYAYKANKPICTTQSCQVFLKSKADNVPDKWKKAVDETKGMILKDPKTSQYSSTTGGYINNTGWDKDGGSWPQDAYEKKAKSPWFYKAWYTQSYADNSSTCGRDTPWLKESEMVDILNAWVVWAKGSSSDRDRISPVTTSCWGGNPYSHSEMAEKADKYGDKYESISSVSVNISNNGYTSRVNFSTNKGNISVDGQEFRTVFNLRAPGYVSFRSRLFDIEYEK